MKTAKRWLTILLTLVMVLSMMSVAVSAAETGYEPTDSYVLNYDGTYGTHKYQYFSPYKARVNAGGAEKNVQTFVFNLYNTRTAELIATYCTDARVSTSADSLYRRLNLEDSTYASGVAGKLRSIIMQSYPNVDEERLGEAAGIEGLTVCESLHATQLAIWRITHDEDDFKILKFYHAITAAKQWLEGAPASPSAVLHHAECYEEVESGYAALDNPLILEHVQALYNYLVNLAPTAPTGVAVSNNSFVSWSEEPLLSKNEDGTYDVTVEVTVDVEMAAQDELTLTAVLGDRFASSELSDGTGTHTLTIQGVPAEAVYGDLTLNIDGSQTVSDVFLFDSTGDRNVSQTMIGITDDQLPVHAEITMEPERIINFTKTSEGEPLEGIRFDIYYVADRDAYVSGQAELPEPAEYRYSGLPDYTVITDANGFGSCNLTKNNMPDGVYLVVEKDHPAVTTPVAPFYVVMPATSADGTGLEYVVNIYPKNEIYNDVDIEKDVISLGNEESTEDAYADHTWIISASIPRDIAQGKSYVISDTLDNRLDYVGNVKVQVESVDGTVVKVELAKDTDYILTVDDQDSLAEGNPSDSFTVSLTSTGMAKVGSAVGTAFAEHKLRVYFDAQINANAQLGVQIPNQATLEYTNSVGFDFEDESDIPVVYTGGARALKVDANDETRVLPGAEFQVYRKATEEEVADESIEKVYIGDMPEPMVAVEFFNDPELTGEKVSTAVSDENGDVYIYGLAYGTYYLVETKAPEGYNLAGAPIELTVNETSHLEENIVQVVNVSGAVLPETGGMGTHAYTFFGLVLMGAACVLILPRKRLQH